MLQDFLPVIITALTVLILGCWNPKGLQVKDKSGNPTGYPNYLWLAGLSALVGAVASLMYAGAQGKRGLQAALSA